MAESPELLHSVHRVPHEKIEVVHISPTSICRTDTAKREIGIRRRSVILTSGLLSPSRYRGHDRRHALDPETPTGCGLCRTWGDASQSCSYQGEAYREADSPCANSASRITSYSDQFVDRATLLEFISMWTFRRALSQRSADDVGYAGLQLRPQQASRLDAVLACAPWPMGAAFCSV